MFKVHVSIRTMIHMCRFLVLFMFRHLYVYMQMSDHHWICNLIYGNTRIHVCFAPSTSTHSKETHTHTHEHMTLQARPPLRARSEDALAARARGPTHRRTSVVLGITQAKHVAIVDMSRRCRAPLRGTSAQCRRDGRMPP